MLQPVEKESAAGRNTELEQYDLSKFGYVPRKKIGRYIAAALILAALLWLSIAFAQGQIEWIYTAKYLFAPIILHNFVSARLKRLPFEGRDYRNFPGVHQRNLRLRRACLYPSSTSIHR